MSMPSRPAPPTGQKRSTQRLLVKTTATGKVAATAPLPLAPAAGSSLNLPAGMILRCLPPEMLNGSLADFENSGAAATEIALPLRSILGQLPSGKVEMPISDLVAQFPPGFLKPGEETAAHLDQVVTLPLMDVVMRIPPDLLAVRPDQKDVDPNVRRLADPFAVAPPAPPAEPRIVEESQVPSTEEFVPQASQALARSIGTPPPPPQPEPPITRQPSSFIPPPRTISPAPLLQQTASLSGRPVPLRATAPMPGRVLPSDDPAPQRPTSTLSASQTLGVPRSPSPLMSASASGPIEPKTPPQLSPLRAPDQMAGPSIAVTAPMPSSAFPAPTIPPVAPPAPPPSTSNADELKRLAVLAMAEMEGKALEGKAAEKASVPEAPPVQAEEAAVPAEEAAPAKPETPAAPDLKQFAFKAPERIPPAEAPVLKPAAPVAATSRFTLPGASFREAAQTTPITPAPVETFPTARTARFTPPVPVQTATPAPSLFSAPSPITESQILPSSAPQPAATAVNLNNCTPDDLLPIPGMTLALASAIVAHRDKIGEFHNLEQLLDVPGMTRAAYSNLTGDTPSSGVHPSINELLGFPIEQELSLKDVTDRICCWPDVTGCLLSQKNGLHLVGTAPDFLDKEAIVAFAPRMFEDVNKSFVEITGKQTDELTIPTTGTSFHLLREKDLYMIILARLPLMPERHLKIARFVLAGLSSRPS
jgi:competence ComEA-like helix-hairpin-helix protein